MTQGTRIIPCPECKGSGKTGIFRSTCKRCDGNGQVEHVIELCSIWYKEYGTWHEYKAEVWCNEADDIASQLCIRFAQEGRRDAKVIVRDAGDPPH